MGAGRIQPPLENVPLHDHGTGQVALSCSLRGRPDVDDQAAGRLEAGQLARLSPSYAAPRRFHQPVGRLAHGDMRPPAPLAPGERIGAHHDQAPATVQLVVVHGGQARTIEVHADRLVVTVVAEVVEMADPERPVLAAFL